MPWVERFGGLQSMGSQRVRHDWATECTHTHIHTHSHTHTHTHTHPTRNRLRDLCFPTFKNTKRLKRGKSEK